MTRDVSVVLVPVERYRISTVPVVPTRFIEVVFNYVSKAIL